MKYFLTTVIVFLIGITAGLVIPSSIKNKLFSSNISNNLEISSDDIMALSYYTNAITLTAQRTKQGEKFALQSTFADGRPVHQCMATEDLAGYLSFLPSLITGKRIDIEYLNKVFPKKLGVLEIRDRSNIRRIPPIEIRATPDEKTIAASYEHIAHELGNKRDVFTKFELGCIALALHQNPN